MPLVIKCLVVDDMTLKCGLQRKVKKPKTEEVNILELENSYKLEEVNLTKIDKLPKIEDNDELPELEKMQTVGHKYELSKSLKRK